MELAQLYCQVRSFECNILRQSRIYTEMEGTINTICLGGVPHVCGGDGGTSSTDSCFEFNFSTLTWSVDGTMPGGEREDVAHAHSAEWGLVMAGGTDSGEDTFYDSVLTTADGASFGTDVPDLPVGTDNACLVVVDAERLFFAGGVTEGGSTADAYLFSRATQVRGGIFFKLIGEALWSGVEGNR